MSTQAQTQANQANALSSTGPVTEAGKQTVSANSVKHGLSSKTHTILPTERAEYEKLLAEYLAHYKPVGPEENRLLSNVAANAVRIRRAQAMEGALFEQSIAEKEERRRSHLRPSQGLERRLQRSPADRPLRPPYPAHH